MVRNDSECGMPARGPLWLCIIVPSLTSCPRPVYKVQPVHLGRDDEHVLLIYAQREMEAAQLALTAAEAQLAAIHADLRRTKTCSAERVKVAAELTRCACASNWPVLHALASRRIQAGRLHWHKEQDVPCARRPA